jgi:type IV pilus assembly protein PilV
LANATTTFFASTSAMKNTIRVQTTSSMAGFTLIEVLIALLVSAVGLLGVAAMGMHALRSTLHAQFISDATMLAQDLESRCKLDRNHLFAGDPTSLPDYQDWLDHVKEILPAQADPVVQRNTNNCPEGNVRCFETTFTWTAPANAQDDKNQAGPPTFTFTYPFAVIMPP